MSASTQSGSSGPAARLPVAVDGALILCSGAILLSTTAEALVARYFLDPLTITFLVSLVAMLVAGIISLRRPGQRGNGRLMLGIVIVVGAGNLAGNHWTVGPFAFLSDVLPWLSDVMIGHLLLRWPRRTLQTRAQRVATVLAYALIPPIIVAADLFWTAHAAGSPATAWWPTLRYDRPLSLGLYRTGVGLFAAMLSVFTALIVLRFVRASRPERRELIAVAVSIGLLLVSGVETVVSTLQGIVDPDLIGNLALAAVPVTFLASLAVRRVQRAIAVEALASTVSNADPAAVVRELRRVMGDRHLDVATYSAELGGYVAPDGEPAVEPAAGRRALFIAANDGGPLARLDVSISLSDRPELSGPIARTVVAALEASRMRVELRVRAKDQEAAREQLEEAQAEGARLSRMLPGGVPEKLRTDPGALGRIDEAVVSVLMSDVRGYTTIAEDAPPARLAQQLREHRAAMNDAILAQGGTIMQYVGDAVMAVFGAPFPQQDHAARAIRAATAMHTAQGVVNSTWAAVDWQPFLLGIGVSSGPVAMAILGSEERYEYTIVGDTVNLAQRLESQARPGGTTLISAETMRLAGPVQFEVEALAPPPGEGSREFRVGLPCPDPEFGRRPEPTFAGARTGGRPSRLTGSSCRAGCGPERRPQHLAARRSACARIRGTRRSPLRRPEPGSR